MAKTNRIRCLGCGEVLESRSVHDFRMCKCGRCGVDGGREYLRRLGGPDDYEELSEGWELEGSGWPPPCGIGEFFDLGSGYRGYPISIAKMLKKWKYVVQEFPQR